MKKIILALFAIAVPALTFAEDAKIVQVYGPVEYRVNQNSVWQKAEKDTMVPEGGAVKSGEAGSALIQMENKSRVWLKENTALEIEQKQSLITRLALVFGKIKVRVPHLRRKEKFDLRTPTAVCAVRGTEFVMESDMEGKMTLEVLFGEVKMSYMITPQKGDKEITLTQGQFLKIEEKDKTGIKGLMDKKQELAGLQKWDPGISEKDSVADIKRKELDRVQIRDFSKQVKNTEDMVNSFMYKGREADIEAGRTLRDVHGNLVRVDQRLMRPDGATLQFFNLVKRTVYADYTSPAKGFTYNGGVVNNRLDLLAFTMQFNQDLPQSISEWPSFFDENDVHALKSSFVFANKTYKDAIFFTAEGYLYDNAREELVNNTNVVGVTPDSNPATPGDDEDVLLTGMLSSFNDLSHVIDLNVSDGGSGTLKINSVNVATAKWGVKNMNSSYEYTGDDAGTDKLYQFKADKYSIGGDAATNGSFWLAQENYVISNSGGIKNTTDFTESTMDPFSILKESAIESITYVKNSNVTAAADLSGSAAYSDIATTDMFTDGTRYPTGTNIDLVIIPDLAIAAIQKVMSALDSLSQ